MINNRDAVDSDSQIQIVKAINERNSTTFDKSTFYEETDSSCLLLDSNISENIIISIWKRVGGIQAL